MSSDEQIYVYESSENNATLSLISADQLIEGQLAVADSWLVENGRVRNLAAHYERFENWVRKLRPELELENFFSAVSALIPKEGAWFPRIELLVSPSNDLQQLVVRLREAPERESSISLWNFNEPDPRVNPTVKGPDLSLGLQMRRAAQMHGADEAVLLNTDGYVIEGALSALVWFRDDVLCAPGDEFPWLPSITRSEVFAIAESMGIQTRNEKVKPADLVGLEIWSLSSLHGIRAVDDWVDLGGPVGAPRHLDAFNKRLRMLSVNLSN